MTDPRPRARRADPPELVELRRLREARPELADAVDLEIGLVGLQRRVQSRLPVPWLDVTDDWLKRQQAEGLPLVRFADVPVTTGELRLLLRETADLLHRGGFLDDTDFERTQALVRGEADLLSSAARWYERSSRPPPDAPPADHDVPDLQIDENVLQLAMRPFLARCAEAFTPRLDPAATSVARRCPLCGGEPEMAMREATDGLLLACSRCTCRWRYAGSSCLFCGCDEREALPGFTTADGAYAVSACDRCRRYLKIVDARRLGRPMLLPADAIATLPLDAAAIQRGYTS